MIFIFLSCSPNIRGKIKLLSNELILEKGWVSDELYYNLGNAYYRSGNISGAIWSYESCLKIKPSHSDAKYNLKLANLRVKDRVDFPEAPFYLLIGFADGNSYFYNVRIHFDIY